MQIAFLDFASVDYTPRTPSEQPLGGMQSALCYLAGALRARGHEVALINQTRQPGTYDGIACVNLPRERVAAHLNNFDVTVSVSAVGKFLRGHGLARPLILWTGHDIDQVAVRPLGDAAERFVWDKIVLVSDWQAARYAAAFRINPQEIKVLRNAGAPAFDTGSRGERYFFQTGRPPVLAYSSTPFRGLEVLLRAFPLIRSYVPQCRARIYSSMRMYQVPPEQDDYQSLYQECRSTEGIEYVGPLGQSELAPALRTADVFAYPCTFLETSCIALIEAMASGCMVISVARGALPETSAGFGTLLTPSPDATDAEFAESYARFAADAIDDARANPRRWAAQLDEQQAFVRESYSWSKRALEWEALLETVCAQPVRMRAPGRNEDCPCGSGRRFKHCCGAL